MTDDVSEIPVSGCSVLVSDSSLRNYNNGTRRDYVRLGNRWHLYQTSTYNQMPVGVSCVDISTLSSYPFMYPVFAFIAFVLVVVVYVLWWFVFKRILRWRK